MVATSQRRCLWTETELHVKALPLTKMDPHESTCCSRAARPYNPQHSSVSATAVTCEVLKDERYCKKRFVFLELKGRVFMSLYVSLRTSYGFRQVHAPFQGKTEKSFWSLNGNGFREEANCVS